MSAPEGRRTPAAVPAIATLAFVSARRGVVLGGSAMRTRTIREAAALLVAVLPVWLVCATTAEPELVDLAAVAPSISIDMRYAGPDNFVGEPIDGYERPRCLLTPAAAHALARLQQDLESHGVGLRVYDCYRPQRAVDHFARWAADASDERHKDRYYPRVEKSQLFDRGYIALRSGHSRGSTVDLTLVLSEPHGGTTEIDMGGHFDLFDPSSHTDSPEVGDPARRNRSFLRGAMERAGFENLPEEWWHYTLRDEPYPDRYWDVVVR